MIKWLLSKLSRKPHRYQLIDINTGKALFSSNDIDVTLMKAVETSFIHKKSCYLLDTYIKVPLIKDEDDIPTPKGNA